MTKKGKGYSFAEMYPEKFHGPGPFNPETGEFTGSSKTPTYSQVFGKAVARFGEAKGQLVAVTAMTDGTGLGSSRISSLIDFSMWELLKAML